LLEDRSEEETMTTEIAELEILPGHEADFEAAAQRAVPLFRRARGCRAMQLRRIVETPGKYRLVVDWETLEDHMVHFRGSEDFQEWRRLVGSHFASPPAVVHTEVVFRAF
jgi:heme-degrading monooxygenase HmoA